jgi:hypothetical protein
MQYGDFIVQLFYRIERWRGERRIILRLILGKLLVRMAVGSD